MWDHDLHPFTTSMEACPGESYYTPTLKGIGILRMANGCSARTTLVELSGNDDRAAKNQYVYEPEMRLNITDIHPELWHHINITRSKDSEKDIPYPLATRKTENMDNIVSHMKEIGDHTRTTTFTHNLIYGGIATQSIIALVVAVVFLLIRKRRTIIHRPTEMNDTNSIAPQIPLTYVALQLVPARAVSTPALMPALPPQLAEID